MYNLSKFFFNRRLEIRLKILNERDDMDSRDLWDPTNNLRLGPSQGRNYKNYWIFAPGQIKCIKSLNVLELLEIPYFVLLSLIFFVLFPDEINFVTQYAEGHPLRGWLVYTSFASWTFNMNFTSCDACFWLFN